MKKVKENKINEEITEQEISSEEYEHAKRKPVIPGEIIVSGEDYLPGDGTRREGNDIVANRFGLAEESGRVIKVIALTGAFIPRRGNVVLGRVTDITFHGWIIDIGSASQAFLPIEESPKFVSKAEMDQFIAIGDIVAAKIWGVKSKGIDLTLKGKGLGKLEGGFVFHTNPNRVPRIIGKEGSMINLIKENTSSNITVGQNGWIWIKADSVDNQIKARKAIEFVVEKVHIEGLTEKMEEWFRNYK
ncbi:MAG: S1 RNA-binding domain-containing protein [Candidatus Pacearchaeota archaeon]|nr:S1 RNA-binding domain-containing protein [Candidatus Pacearchaeota archaeon]